MNIIDTHCDVLLKLQMAKRGEMFGQTSIRFQDSDQLDSNLIRLKQGGVQVQFFAIFIEPDVPSDEKWQHALEQIDLFYTEVLEKHSEIKHITKWSDFDSLKENEMGAVLTLEGADAFGDDLVKLRHLYRLGVMEIGLTWNNANLCADGAGEPRGGGLTLLGKEVVRLNNQHKVLTDVSHATVNGFWDIMELADYPFASHSNARAICEHPRNLYDDQIKQLFANNGVMHVVFHPLFVSGDENNAGISDLLRHIDHLCELGGIKKIGFGSDFDGIDHYVRGLENASQYPNLINELQKHYTEEEVKGFCYQNFLDHLPL